MCQNWSQQLENEGTMYLGTVVYWRFAFFISKHFLLWRVSVNRIVNKTIIISSNDNLMNLYHSYWTNMLDIPELHVHNNEHIYTLYHTILFYDICIYMYTLKCNSWGIGFFTILIVPLHINVRYSAIEN